MHTARAGHVHVICPAYHFSRLQFNHLETRGLNLVDLLLWACAIVVAGAEGYPLVTRGSNLVDRLLWARAIVVAAAERYKVHVPWGGAINIRGIL